MSVGLVEVIYGPMFAGKSSELIRQVRLAKIAGIECRVFKPIIDTRYIAEKVCNHDGQSIDVKVVKNSEEILNFIDNKTQKVFIDEAQFFDRYLPEVVDKISRNLKMDVICAGLNLNYRGEAFGPMPKLMGLAQKTISLSAICTHTDNGKICGGRAYFTDRLVESDENIILGEKDVYAARCEKHWRINFPNL